MPNEDVYNLYATAGEPERSFIWATENTREQLLIALETRVQIGIPRDLRQILLYKTRAILEYVAR